MWVSYVLASKGKALLGDKSETNIPYESSYGLV